MAVSELSRKIKDGDIDAIIEGFLSDSGCYRAQAIIGAVNNQINNKAIEKLLYRMKNDELAFLGYSISDLATAALDKLGIEKYKGKDSGILLLIESDKWWN